MDLAVIEVIVGPVSTGSQSRPEFLYGSSGPVGTTENVTILFFFLPFFDQGQMVSFLRPY